MTAVSAAPQRLEEGYETLWRTAADVLENNWSRDHAVPSRTLYPHQWSWDTAFISVGLAYIAPDRAWRDMHSLFEAQWPDGRVPHIVFDLGISERNYFPGPTFWDVPAMPTRPAQHSSGIVQPPAHAMAAWEVYRRSPNDMSAAELRWLYPRLVAEQDYLYGCRDIGGYGLASILHPWESGLDNSPAWDDALSAVPREPDTLRRHRRQDVNVATVDHRPTDDDYARYILIGEAYRDNGYRDDEVPERHPFIVECPAFNALLGAAEQALARIATVVGADPAPHRDRAAATTESLVERLYNPETGVFHALDVRTGQLSPAWCINGLIPLILSDLPPTVVARLAATANSPRFGLTPRMPLPSYDRTAHDFDAMRYWRGPVWINANWLLWRGLGAHGYGSLAGTLRKAMLDLIGRSGYYEYFHPVTGEGIGAANFSWTAALALDLLAHDGPRIHTEAMNGARYW